MAQSITWIVIDWVFQIRIRCATTTSGTDGRVGPTSNDGDQNQREGQIADPSLVA
jgi:hypothetical protein